MFSAIWNASCSLLRSLYDRNVSQQIMARGRKRKATEALDIRSSPESYLGKLKKSRNKGLGGTSPSEPRLKIAPHVLAEVINPNRAEKRTATENSPIEGLKEPEIAVSDSEILSEEYWDVEYIITEDRTNDRYKVKWLGEYPSSWVRFLAIPLCPLLLT